MAQNIEKYKPSLPLTANLWRRILYSKIENIFVYENLPEEIPVRFMNLCLFKTGKIVFYKIGDKYTVQPFSYNDILNWYYVPVKGRVVNPYLPSGHQNWEFTIDDEAVIYNSSPDIYNYKAYSVVADLIFKTANQLSENDISYYCIQRNSRLIAMFSAETDLQKKEMNKILDKMYNGETDITMEESLVAHIHANPLTQNSTRNSITELIEFQQYILANFYHSFGINSNYNLKREQLNSDEIDVNQEVLRLNIEDMLKCREDGVSKINEKFGLNISVHLNEKLYATLLQQSADLEMSQNETNEIPLESEDENNAEKENRNNSERNDSSDENSDRQRNYDSDNDTGNGHKSGSDNGDATSSDSRSDNEDKRNGGDSIRQNNSKRNSSSDNIQREMDNKSDDENGEGNNRNIENNDISDRESGSISDNDREGTDTEEISDDMASANGELRHENGGSGHLSDSGTVININIDQADGVEISTEKPNVSIDEELSDETSQNETNEKESDEDV